MKQRLALRVWIICLLPAPGYAHFHMLIPDQAAPWPGTSVQLTFSYGHPFEHELITTAAPAAIKAYPPGEAPVSPRLSKESERLTYRYRYDVDKRGDHIVVARTVPLLQEAHGEILEAHLKVILHAASQRGWDRSVGQAFEILPLTRPYGLRPGWVFQGKALLGGKPLENAQVEIERYNPEPPGGKIPEDEFVTRSLRTGPGGVFTATLDEKGWWIVTAVARQGLRKHTDGKEYPVVLRSTLCLYVGPLRRG